MASNRKRERSRALAKAVARAGEAERRLRLTAAERLGLGVTDFDALMLLDTAGPLAASRIAEALAITTGAVTGLIDRLERAGFVQRNRHETDRRQVVIEVSPARREELEAHWQEREQFVAEALGEVDDAAVDDAIRLIDAIATRTLEGLTTRVADRAAQVGDADRAPIGAIESGRLRASGVARLELRGARIKDLYRAAYQGKRPQITVESDGLVTLQYKGVSWLGMSGVSAQVALTTALPWAIEIRRGASHLVADLHELEVTAIDITGGATECELTLPRPHGLATLRITGGASRVAIKRPRGAAAQIAIRGGASNLVFDDQRVPAVGNAIQLASPGFDAASDRWTIELTGGASSLSVTEQ